MSTGSYGSDEVSAVLDALGQSYFVYEIPEEEQPAYPVQDSARGLRQCLEHLRCSTHNETFLRFRKKLKKGCLPGSSIESLWPAPKQAESRLKELLESGHGSWLDPVPKSRKGFSLFTSCCLTTSSQGKITGLIGTECQLMQKPPSEPPEQQLGKEILNIVQPTLDSIEDLIIVVDKKGRIILINKAVSQTIGIPSEKLVGQRAEVIRSKLVALCENPEKHRQVVDSIYDDPLCTRDDEFPLRTNPPKYFHRHTEPILDNQGNVLARLWRLSDITPRIKTEKFQKNLLATLSHEIKTPLASIQGYLETILQKKKTMPAKTEKRFLQVALKNAQNLSLLVNNLLNLAPLDGGIRKSESVRCRLREVFANVRDAIHQAAWDKKIKISASIPRNLPPIQIDPISLFQILLNLLDNAVKYSPENCEVTLKAEVLPRNLIRISIEDKGPGIPTAFRERIFEQFFRLPQNGQPGSGLGLAIVKQIVDAYSGRIEVTGRPGKGSCFKVTLPGGKKLEKWEK